MSVFKENLGSKKIFSLVGWYTLGLVIILVAIQISKKSLLPNSALELEQLLILILIFGFGLWIGYTWNSGKLEKRRKMLLWESLTAREEEVAKLIIEGLSNKQISNELFIENNTVKTHLKNIYKKSRCNGRKEFSDKFYI